MRRYISQSEVEMLVHAVISSRLGYCNSLLFGVQKVQGINKLQRVQNQASKLVLRKGRLQRFPWAKILEILHWLPVHKRIVFKILVITYNCFNCHSPTLLSSLLVPKFTNNGEVSHDYDIRFFFPTLEVGRRAFVYYAPRLWNCLPIELRKCETKILFKIHLKTFLWSFYDSLMNDFNHYIT